MKLSLFIQEHKDKIAQEWVKYAQENIDCAENMDLEEVSDHVQKILERISVDMETTQTEDQQEKRSKGNKKMSSGNKEAAIAHGEQRLDLGFDFMQLSSEFRALRASVLRLWSHKGAQENWKADFHDMIRFNEAIDEIWMGSLNRFQTTLDESKNLFLGILGHDLRNPIATIKGANSFLSLSDNLTEKEKKMLRLSQSSTKRMTELIDNLLELTELRLGTGLTINKATYDLQERVREIVHELQIAYPEATIVLDAEGPVKGEWDILRVEQMVNNLIINAIRHGKSGGIVQVKISQEREKALISVKNDGSPIPEEIQGKIFNGRFFKSSGTNGMEKSYGLGLFIVKEIVEGHRGEIDVESNSKDGTTFTVRLPLKISN